MLRRAIFSTFGTLLTAFFALQGTQNAFAQPFSGRTLVQNSDVWAAPARGENKKPAFMAFDARHNALWTANVADNTVSMRDAKNGVLQNEIRVGNAPSSLAIDGTRHRVWVVNADDHTLWGIDSDTRAIVARVEIGQGAQLCALDERSGDVYSANFGDNSVSIFNEAKQQIQTVKVGKNPFGLAVDSVRRRVYVSNSADASISILDADSHAILQTIATTPAPLTLAVEAQSGALLVAHSENGFVDFLPNPSEGLAFSIATGGYPLGLCADSERGRIYIADYDDQNLIVLDSNGQILQRLAVGEAPSGLTWDAQSGRVWVCSEASNQMDVFDWQKSVRPAPNYAPTHRPAPLIPLLPATEPAALNDKLPIPQAEETDAEIAAEIPQLPLPEAPPFNSNPTSRPNAIPNNPTRPTIPTPPRPALTPIYAFEEAPLGSIGARIAAEAQKLQNSGAARTFVHKCDRLADTAIERATRKFGTLVGPHPNDNAAQTMHRFQNAGLGFAFRPGMKLRAGDLLYANERAGQGSGHAMIVGPTGLFLDQYGANTRPIVRPNWVVRPDQALAGR